MKMNTISLLLLSIFHNCTFSVNYSLVAQKFVNNVDNKKIWLWLCFERFVNSVKNKKIRSRLCFSPNNKKSESYYVLVYWWFVTTLDENTYYFILASVHFPFRIFPFHCNFISEKFVKCVNNKNLNMCTYMCFW